MNSLAIHNLSPDVYSQIVGKIPPQYDSGWEVVNDPDYVKPVERSERRFEDATLVNNDAESDFSRFLQFQKPDIPRPIAPKLNSSSVSGNNSWNDYQTPFVTIINKRPVGTEDLNKYRGLPLEAKVKLGDLTGYTVVSDIFLPQDLRNSLPQEEVIELKTLLQAGVIL